ncbi:hypothetical protein ACQ4PT_008160 [Festuca glaucescens]
MTMDALCGASDVLVHNTFNAAAASSFHFGNAGGASTDGTASWMAGSAMVAPPVSVAMPAEEWEKVPAGRRKRRRRAKVCRNREDAESQRMTHIAVERNRRRQMNEYLAELRSLMPESYAHRGDQASIVGGAIDFVKELEQLLQSLEAQKRTLLMQKQQQQREPPIPDAMPAPSNAVVAAAATTSSGSGSGEEAPAPAATHDATGTPFAGFFTYPQYVWRLPPRDGADDDRAGAADVEVTLVETHASVRVMAPRRPGQLLRMVTGMERLRLAVLHLNVTTLDSLALYSLSVKVEEGCGLATADDIAAAVHRLLCFIDAETTSRRLLELGDGRPDLQS